MLFASSNNELYAQSHMIKKVSNLYDSLRSHKIENPKTVLAIAMYETGWMKCKSCALDGNNLFGFRTNKDFLKFSNIYESIKYLKRWQTRYYHPWRAKNPDGTYYEYLKYIGYCDNMDSYIKNIKSIEQWLSMNVENVE
jgi:hypothetical protein